MIVCMYGDFSAKITAYTLYIRIYVCFWPTPLDIQLEVISIGQRTAESAG